MRIIGAGTRFPKLNEARWGEAAGRPPLACARPEAAPGEFAFDFALPASKEILKQAGCRPSQIDLILGLAVSPDRVVDLPAHTAPRIGSPLQNALGATNAYTLDLLDADWSFAIDVAAGYAAQQGYERILVVRAESAAGLLPDSESGFAVPDGAGVLLLCPAEGGALPWTQFRSLEGFTPPSVPLLPREAMLNDSPRAKFLFPYRDGLVEGLNQSGREMLREEIAEAGRAEYAVAESWFPGHLPASALASEGVGRFIPPPEHLPHPGPFTLPLAAAGLLSRGGSGAEALISLTFSPCDFRCACQRLRL